jgi:hypothetical protein
VILTALSLVASLSIRPHAINNFTSHPWGWLIPAMVVVSLIALPLCRARKKDQAAFVASSVYIIGTLGGAAFALYPVLLPASTDPRYSLTIENAKTGAYSLRVGLIWWLVGIALAIVYFTFLYRFFRGKVRLTNDGYGPALGLGPSISLRISLPPDAVASAVLYAISPPLWPRSSHSLTVNADVAAVWRRADRTQSICAAQLLGLRLQQV